MEKHRFLKTHFYISGHNLLFEASYQEYRHRLDCEVLLSTHPQCGLAYYVLCVTTDSSVKFTEHISGSYLLTYIYFRPAGMVRCGGGSVVETLNSLQKDRLRSSNSSRDTNSRLRIAIAPTVYKQLFINATYTQ